MIDWQAGDLAKCIKDFQYDPEEGHPEVKEGGEYIVADIDEYYCTDCGGVELFLRPINCAFFYAADHFRKIQPSKEEPKVQVKEPELI